MAWESERQWMVSNIRQIPEEDEVRAAVLYDRFLDSAPSPNAQLRRVVPHWRCRILRATHLALSPSLLTAAFYVVDDVCAYV